MHGLMLTVLPYANTQLLAYKTDILM